VGKNFRYVEGAISNPRVGRIPEEKNTPHCSRKLTGENALQMRAREGHPKETPQLPTLLALRISMKEDKERRRKAERMGDWIASSEKRRKGSCGIKI